MAGTGRKSSAGRAQYEESRNSRTYVYVEGTAVRRLEPAGEPERRQKPAVSRRTRRNRERALAMNLGYVIFLAAAAVITVFMCVNFLKLQTKGTRLQKDVTALEAQLDAAVLENNSDYNRIMSSVDMEQVKDIAMNELGMIYAKRSQIVTYKLEQNDYVRQYSEVPEE